jgi:hypothetical protein
MAVGAAISGLRLASSNQRAKISRGSRMIPYHVPAIRMEVKGRGMN